MTAKEHLDKRPDAAQALRKYFSIPMATNETLSRYFVTYGSSGSWWCSLGAPHVAVLETKRQPTESMAIEVMATLLENAMLQMVQR